MTDRYSMIRNGDNIVYNDKETRFMKLLEQKYGLKCAFLDCHFYSQLTVRIWLKLNENRVSESLAADIKKGFARCSHNTAGQYSDETYNLACAVSADFQRIFGVDYKNEDVSIYFIDFFLEASIWVYSDIMSDSRFSEFVTSIGCIRKVLNDYGDAIILMFDDNKKLQKFEKAKQQFIALCEELRQKYDIHKVLESVKIKTIVNEEVKSLEWNDLLMK